MTIIKIQTLGGISSKLSNIEYLLGILDEVMEIIISSGNW